MISTVLRLPTYPDVRPALAALSTLPMAIASEGTPRMLQAVIRQNGLERFFPVVVSADDVERYKPAPAPYLLTAQRLDVEPGDLLFVTAHGWDLAGASAAGLQTAWLKRKGEPPEQLGVKPDLVLTSIQELRPRSEQ